MALGNTQDRSGPLFMRVFVHWWRSPLVDRVIRFAPDSVLDSTRIQPARQAGRIQLGPFKGPAGLWLLMCAGVHASALWCGPLVTPLVTSVG